MRIVVTTLLTLIILAFAGWLAIVVWALRVPLSRLFGVT